MAANGATVRRAVSLASVTVLMVAGLVLTLFSEESDAAFPGNNNRIVFVSDRDGDNEIFTMNPDGTDQTNLTNNTATEFEPTWYDDGTKIAFV